MATSAHASVESQPPFIKVWVRQGICASNSLFLRRKQGNFPKMIKIDTTKRKTKGTENISDTSLCMTTDLQDQTPTFCTVSEQPHG